MKISIKTIKGEVFAIEIEPSNTIHDLKKKIEAIKNMDVSTQKLILKGANTSDENTLEFYGVKEGDFLVVMQTKKLAQSAQSQPQNVNPNPVQPQVQPQQAQPKPPATQSQPVGNILPQGFEQTSASNVVLGDKFNQTVDEICKMGFPKEEAIKALKAAFNNPDRAIDYLINGIPDIPEEHHQQQAHPHPPVGNVGGGQLGAGLGGLGLGTGAGTGLAGPVGGAGGSEAFLQLLNNPQFQMVRNLIRQNPQMLQGILMQLQQSNPDLFNLITQNQEAFTRWLTEGGTGAAAGGQNVVHVTPEEKEAIDRLVALGFDKQAVIQAYLVCDKDEQLAANLLFDQANQGDFDDVPLPARVGGQGTGVQGMPVQPAGQQPGAGQGVGQQPAEQQNVVNPPPPPPKPEEKQEGIKEEKEKNKKEGEQGGDNKDKKNDKDDDDSIFS